MNLSHIFNNTTKFVKLHSAEILTTAAVSGVLTTSYLTGKAAFKAGELVYKDELVGGPNNDRKERFKERAKLTWRLYVPAGIAGVSTVACIVGASRVNGRRTAAAVTAYSLTEKAFSEYKEKVIEQIGKGQEQKIRDELAQEQVTKSPPGQVIIAGSGDVMCCELYTHRYFKSNMETLRKAQNDINARIINELYVTLDEFYDRIGISSTCVSNELGWDSNKMMELEFSTVLSENGEPCLAFKYNYLKPL